GKRLGAIWPAAETEYAEMRMATSGVGKTWQVVASEGFEADASRHVVPVELPSILFSIPRNPAVAVGLPIALGFASGFITKSSVKTWYKPLTKPPVSVRPTDPLTVWLSTAPSTTLIHFTPRASPQDWPSRLRGPSFTLRWGA
ncbi:hypothetical protein P7C70_g7809, partial [Phenoliferia sp. Uapishka_3]